MVRVLSDSSTLLSIEDAHKQNLDVIPLSITINGETYKENEEITTGKLVEIINEGHMPMSSQPAIGEVINTYNKYKNDEIINITMADGLSGTYNSACMAKNMDDNGDRIEVVNSKTLCGPHRYLSLTAASLANEGKSKSEIIDVLNDLINTSISFLIPKDFDYLVKGGRLSKTAGKLGGLMKVVPVMQLEEDGKSLKKYTVCRTFNKAIARICDYYLSNGIDENYKIYVTHACNIEMAQNAKDIINSKIEGADVEIMELSPVFTTHGGPGCIAVQTIKKYMS